MSLVISFGYAKRTECYEAPKYDSLSILSDNKNDSNEDSGLIKGSDINIYVQEINEPIEIDGKLNEKAWERAIPYHDYFFQHEPLDRAPSSEKTEVRVLQDKHNIYFSAQCYDSEPKKIWASVKRRDGKYWNGDALEFLIDTFQDKRNCYALGTNPLDAKIDALISDEGNHVNNPWDCIWYNKTSINDSGWVVEMKIPFKSIKYKKGEVVDWGLNIARAIKHRQEMTYLVPIPRGLGHNGKFKGSLFANLKNVKPPSYKINLEIQPYTTGGKTYIYRPNAIDSEFKSGLDVRYHVTPQLSLDLTYKTDFANVESDQEIINVTRFNINLPEKREFFLESAGLFQFGSGTSAGGSLVGSSGGSSGFMMFNSRTIGIKKGKRIPLFGGAKLAGRIGKYSIGVMNIQSEKTAINDSTFEPSTNFTAIKLKRDLHTNSNIGLMILNKQSNSGDYNRTIGSDAFFAFTPEFIINGSIAKSFSPEDLSKEWAGNIGVILNKDWVDLSVRYSHIDTLFNPEMGFVRRGNIRNTNGSLSFTKWINNDYFKSMSFVNRMSYTTDHHNTLETRQNSASLWVTAKSGDFLSFGVSRDYDFLPNDQFIRNIMIEKGVYNAAYQNISFRSFRGRPLSGSISYRWGERLDGKSRSVSLSNTTKISNDLVMNLGYSYDNLDFKNGSLKANILSGRWTYCYSPELLAKYYVQWNDADHKIAMNFLIDYIYKPRSHIYLVYNENRDTLINSVKNINDRVLLLKFTYLWSL
ncbi:DUF5916 domain-containing protein [candidate division KSB1 bacterium]